jgi:hypothetical protein
VRLINERAPAPTTVFAHSADEMWAREAAATRGLDVVLNDGVPPGLLYLGSWTEDAEGAE